MNVTIAQVIAQLAAFVGIVASFWHIDWIAGVTFLAAGLGGVLVHSAGYWRLEQESLDQRLGPMRDQLGSSAQREPGSI